MIGLNLSRPRWTCGEDPVTKRGNLDLHLSLSFILQTSFCLILPFLCFIFVKNVYSAYNFVKLQKSLNTKQRKYNNAEASNAITKTQFAGLKHFQKYNRIKQETMWQNTTFQDKLSKKKLSKVTNVLFQICFLFFCS